ncbi:hypothetical protein ADK57_25910 [Streptomyces sp. MMG1533]|nr:hypothetical protein ADK57_25910 [Streptomyces sp. MMG1533]
MFAAVEEIAADKPTAIRIDDPAVPSWADGSRIGTAPPVEQPGRPSMTPQATGASVMMIAAGWLSLCLGAAVSAVLYFSHGANETVVIALCAAPPVTFFSLGALVKKVKQAAPDVINNHYNGPVHQDQREVKNKNTGIWVKNTNG